MGTSDRTPAQLLIPVPFLGTVNLWLLRGEPLTLVDTGPRSDEALWALEQAAPRPRARRRGHRAAAAHAPSSRPHRSRRPDQGALGRARRRARRDRRVGRRLPRAGRRRAPLHGSDCSRRTASPSRLVADTAAVLGAHRPRERGLRDGRRAARRRRDRRGRPDAPRRAPARSQHDRHALRRRRRERGDRRRPPSRARSRRAPRRRSRSSRPAGAGARCSTTSPVCG